MVNEWSKWFLNSKLIVENLLITYNTRCPKWFTYGWQEHLLFACEWVCRVTDKNSGFVEAEVQIPGQAVWLWTSDFTSLYLSFPLCKMGMITVPASEDGED